MFEAVILTLTIYIIGSRPVANRPEGTELYQFRSVCCNTKGYEEDCYDVIQQGYTPAIIFPGIMLAV